MKARDFKVLLDTIRKNNLPFSSYCISYLQNCYIITYSEVCSFIVAHTEVYRL